MLVNNSKHNYTYRAYGLYFSSNHPIPNLVQVKEDPGLNALNYLDQPVCINFRGLQSWFPIPTNWSNLYQSPSHTVGNRPFLEVWQHETGLHLRHSNNAGENGIGANVDFSMGLAGETIDIAWTPAMLFQDIVAYLLGPVLGCILRLRGVTCLHGAVMAIEEGAIAIIGPKGAGKSTTAAFFVQQGRPLLSDDIAPLVNRDGQFWVQPGYPCLRLWPKAIDILCSSQVNNLPLVLSFSEKRYFPLALKDREVASRQFQLTPLPLVGIYLLDRFDTGASPSLLPMTLAMSLVSLVRNTYVDYVLSETGRSREFRELGQLVSGIPVKQVRRPENLEILPKLYQIILQDCCKSYNLTTFS